MQVPSNCRVPSMCFIASFVFPPFLPRTDCPSYGEKVNLVALVVEKVSTAHPLPETS